MAIERFFVCAEERGDWPSLGHVPQSPQQACRGAAMHVPGRLPNQHTYSTHKQTQMYHLITFDLHWTLLRHVESCCMPIIHFKLFRTHSWKLHSKRQKSTKSIQNYVPATRIRLTHCNSKLSVFSRWYTLNTVIIGRGSDIEMSLCKWLFYL